MNLNGLGRIKWCIIDSCFTKKICYLDYATVKQKFQ